MKFTVHNLVITGLMTAVICVISPFSIPLGFSPVPLTLATFAVCLVAMVTGPLKGTLCCFLYLCLGMVGLPVFSGFSGGIHRLFGPTGGYLFGYLMMAYITGLVTQKYFSKWYLCFGGLVLGTISCYLLGTAWLCIQMHISPLNGLYLGVIPYIPADLAKIVLTLFTGIPLRRALLRHSFEWTYKSGM